MIREQSSRFYFMKKPQDFRKCPDCKKPGVDVREVYPNGTNCKYCLKHIEVNITAVVIILGVIVGIMVIDLRYYDTGVGFLAAMLLIFVGAFYQKAYGIIMPLRHYDDV